MENQQWRHGSVRGWADRVSQFQHCWVFTPVLPGLPTARINDGAHGIQTPICQINDLQQCTKTSSVIFYWGLTLQLACLFLPIYFSSNFVVFLNSLNNLVWTLFYLDYLSMCRIENWYFRRNIPNLFPNNTLGEDMLQIKAINSQAYQRCRKIEEDRFEKT